MKLSEKYSEKSTLTVGTENYSLTDTLENIFPLNVKSTDKSIAYTSGNFPEFNTISAGFDTKYTKQLDEPFIISGSRTFHTYEIKNMITDTTQKYIIDIIMYFN